MNEFLLALLQAVLIAAVPVCTAYAVKGLSALARYFMGKTENDTAKKYLADVTDIISTAVSCTSQTYVDDLKHRGAFTQENHTKALAFAMDTAKRLLTVEARRFLEEAYGDLDTYLKASIETEVRTQKFYNNK